jgi:MinD-like ATPase involved in chromosome partitioning or flagellar assembly
MVGRGQIARERAWSEALGRRPAAPRVVAFTAGKGGVGTTSAAAGVALTIAALLPGTVALADTRSGTASLGLFIGGVPAPDAVAFAGGSVEPLRVDGVTVVDGAPWRTPLNRPTLARILADLREDHLYTVLDVGDDASDIGHGALARADRVAVVTTNAPDALAAAHRTLVRLHGIDAARAGAVVVAVTGAKRGRRGQSRREPLPHAGPVVHLPWDPSLATGSGLEIDRLRRETRAAYLELAALISEDFAE